MNAEKDLPDDLAKVVEALQYEVRFIRRVPGLNPTYRSGQIDALERAERLIKGIAVERGVILPLASLSPEEGACTPTTTTSASAATIATSTTDNEGTVTAKVARGTVASSASFSDSSRSGSTSAEPCTPPACGSCLVAPRTVCEYAPACRDDQGFSPGSVTP